MTKSIIFLLLLPQISQIKRIMHTQSFQPSSNLLNQHNKLLTFHFSQHCFQLFPILMSFLKVVNNINRIKDKINRC